MTDNSAVYMNLNIMSNNSATIWTLPTQTGVALGNQSVFNFNDSQLGSVSSNLFYAGSYTAFGNYTIGTNVAVNQLFLVVFDSPHYASSILTSTQS
jgi:hypothetical protein